MVDFVERLMVNAVMEYDDPRERRPNKVGAWLMNEEATMWDEVCGSGGEQAVGRCAC